jgi:putative toxin-antitoxin system antitoxin component (TIGR02293 family)
MMFFTSSSPGATTRRIGDRNIEFTTNIDQLVLLLFASIPIRRMLRDQSKLSLDVVWARTVNELSQIEHRQVMHLAEPMAVHDRIVAGLPGEALFISSSMLYDSLQEALPLFNVSAKTARLRIGNTLQTNEGEIALRIGRVVALAGKLFGSFEDARNYLRTPNFALGGAIPRDLLKTASGEQIVLGEIQTQAEGGPV